MDLRRLGLSALFVLLANALVAQDIYVLHEYTSQPLAEVSIQSMDGRLLAESNEDGVATLSGINAQDTLILSLLGFRTLTITLKEIQASYGFIFLKPDRLPPLVITPNQSSGDIGLTQSHVVELDLKDLQHVGNSSMADVLEQSGEVFVQKSQFGGGSPILRGMEANKLVLVLDGVRLNNAIYRSGHLQNVISVDHASLSNVEVIMGPSSLIYGSDALGGVIHMHTIHPELLHDSLTRISAGGGIQYQSASSALQGHVAMKFRSKRLATYHSVTYKTLGDLRMGARRSSAYPDFGKRTEYVTQIAGIDSVVPNPDENLQLHTGYEQINSLQKLLFRTGGDMTILLTHLYSISGNIPRYDKLAEKRNGQLRFAEWNYGPQLLHLLSADFSLHADIAIWDELNVQLAGQQVREQRIERRYRSNMRSVNTEDVGILSVNIDAYKKIKRSRLDYGLSWHWNDVQSTAFREDVVTLAKSEEATRYPNGGSKTMSLGAFARQIIRRKKSTYLFGLRYSYNRLTSSFENSTVFVLPLDQVTLQNGAITGSAEWRYRPNTSWRINALVSSGFRSPNVDDYGKVFETGGVLIVPNPDVKPEYAWSGEAGVERTKGRIQATGNVYATYLTQAIVRRPFTMNGQDSLTFNGETYPIAANTNADKAVVFGGSFRMSAELLQTEQNQLHLDASVSWTRGRDMSNDLPLAHIPPLFGKGRLQWAHGGRWEAAVWVLWNGWKRVKDYAPNSSDNLEEATIDGTPAWYTLNFSARYLLKNGIRFQAGMENMLDMHYRPFSSGVSAAGRNIIVGLQSPIR